MLSLLGYFEISIQRSMPWTKGQENVSVKHLFLIILVSFISQSIPIRAVENLQQ